MSITCRVRFISVLAATLASVSILVSAPVLADQRTVLSVSRSVPLKGGPAGRQDAQLAQPSDAVVVPILMYHHVRVLPPRPSRIWRRLTVEPGAFDAQMSYLAEHGFHAISFAALADYFETGAPLPTNPIIITLDDGWVEQYTTAYPVLQKYGLTATFFPPTQWVDNSRLTLTWAQVAEMSAGGMEFGSHTVNHHLLSKENSYEVAAQLAQSRSQLEQHTGRPVIALAYPGGDYNRALLPLVSRMGYRAAVGILPGVEHRRTDILTLHRVTVVYGESLARFIASLEPPQSEP
jgi:peptidoglycan/xylan/chitin deacetylase (PgdA/CDA1 family)